GGGDAVRAPVVGRAAETAGGVVDQVGEPPALVPDALHHRIDRRGIADVDRMCTNDTTAAGDQLLRGALQHRPAPPAKPELGAEFEVFGSDLLAQARAAAGDEDALTLEQAFLEHARF